MPLDPALVWPWRYGPENGQRHLWLTTLDDGRVLFAGTRGFRYRAAILGVEPFLAGAKVRVAGVHTANGRLEDVPVVRYGTISLPLLEDAAFGLHRIRPVSLTLSDFH